MGCILRPTRAIWATFNEKRRPTQNAPQKKGPGGWGVRGTTGALWNLGEVVFIWANSIFKLQYVLPDAMPPTMKIFSRFPKKKRPPKNRPNSTNSQQANVLITFAFPFTTIDFFLELTDNQRQCVLIYQLDAVGVLAKGEHRHRVPGSLACPRGCAGSLGLRK